MGNKKDEIKDVKEIDGQLSLFKDDLVDDKTLFDEELKGETIKLRNDVEGLDDDNLLNKLFGELHFRATGADDKDSAKYYKLCLEVIRLKNETEEKGKSIGAEMQDIINKLKEE